jgi:hypothetical protein
VDYRLVIPADIHRQTSGVTAGCRRDVRLDEHGVVDRAVVAASEAASSRDHGWMPPEELENLWLPSLGRLQERRPLVCDQLDVAGPRERRRYIAGHRLNVLCVLTHEFLAPRAQVVHVLQDGDDTPDEEADAG